MIGPNYTYRASEYCARTAMMFISFMSLMLVHGFMSGEIRGVAVFRRERDETNQSLLFAKAREAGEEGEEGEEEEEAD